MRNGRTYEGAQPVEVLSPIPETPAERASIVGANIRRARREHGDLSQERLALMLGIRRQHLSDNERGVHEANPRRLNQIAALLGIADPTVYFYTRHDDTE